MKRKPFMTVLGLVSHSEKELDIIDCGTIVRTSNNDISSKLENFIQSFKDTGGDISRLNSACIEMEKRYVH